MLLQLLRGAGVKGLAAMPLFGRLRAEGEGEGKSENRSSFILIPHPSILRRLLDVPRAEIEALRQGARPRVGRGREQRRHAVSSATSCGTRCCRSSRSASRRTAPPWRARQRHLAEAGARCSTSSPPPTAPDALRRRNARGRRAAPALAGRARATCCAISWRAGASRCRARARLDEALRQALTAQAGRAGAGRAGRVRAAAVRGAAATSCPARAAPRPGYAPALARRARAARCRNWAACS